MKVYAIKEIGHLTACAMIAAEHLSVLRDVVYRLGYDPACCAYLEMTVGGGVIRAVDLTDGTYFAHNDLFQLPNPEWENLTSRDWFPGVGQYSSREEFGRKAAALRTRFDHEAREILAGRRELKFPKTGRPKTRMPVWLEQSARA